MGRVPAAAAVGVMGTSKKRERKRGGKRWGGNNGMKQNSGKHENKSIVSRPTLHSRFSLYSLFTGCRRPGEV